MVVNENKTKIFSAKKLYKRILIGQEIDNIIALWRSGKYRCMEDVWLCMQELQIRIAKEDELQRRKLDMVMKEVSEKLWEKYEQGETSD